MSEKHLVCHEAECECQFGNAPDKLLVKTQSSHYINDKTMSAKLIATDKEIGQPFQKNTFGNCKLQPTPSGYKPCQPVITSWTDFYSDVLLEENQGCPLLESSKAICAISGAPCVSITFHGQEAEVSEQNMDNTEPETLEALNPIAPMKKKTNSALNFKLK